MRNPIRLIGIALLFVVMLGLAGCHTAKGFGEDVEGAGEEIQKAAE